MNAASASREAGEVGDAAGAAVRARMTGFLKTLRDNHFAVGLDEARDALVLAEAGYGRRASALRPALRALLCARPADWQRFEALFDAHWLGRGVRAATMIAGQPQKAPAGVNRVAGKPGAQGAPDGLPDHVERGGDTEAAGEGEATRGGASRAEVLETTDLRHVADPDAIAEVNALVERLARRMRYRLTRRERLRRKGRRIDLRATIRHSVGRGGEPIDLMRRKRRETPLRIVALLDVSASMSQYSAFFLRFLHGILDHVREADAFLFHTRLVHVSPVLREKDPQKALDRLSLVARGFSGGTKIGESIATFNRQHAARVVHGRTAVIIMSDGYDTGDAEGLAEALASLRKRTRRIVWLNPMAGWDDYAPLAAGMQAALPYLDLFAPAHNLESLAELEPYLARI
ncbi:VWA domain-containing protein [Breoghania sp. L-A4]|uniref:vWA domain-containing protein n=1 Tax=Breoghania sp. L-A4 TaxID=2304600 RepID=UPI000E358AD8|nr:VWA domain-containing protein [Breoghania sp. L-A4]AXS40037.1 VWA domain-containing protein [Breoghania sp. L-A4]